MKTGGGEKRFHDQISWLMFIFSIFVIWVHSYNADLFSDGVQNAVWSAVDQIENFVSVGLGQIAVPGFFLLSSYLFFRNFSWDQLFRKWKSRVFSVLIPYVVWNLLYYLGYMAASRLFAMQSVVGRDVIPLTIQEMWRAVSEYAYAPIFWYLYQLVFLIIFSPVIYALVKNRTIGLFWIMALVFAVHLHLDMRHPNTDALLYYSVAAYFAVHRRGLVERSMAEEAAAERMTGSKNKDEENKGSEAGHPDDPARKRDCIQSGKITKGEDSCVHDSTRRRCMAEGAAGVIVSIFCYRRMMAPGADVLWTCFYRMAVPMTCWAFACGIRLPKVQPWMRQSMFLYAIHFVVVRFVNKGTAILTGGLAGTAAAAGIAVAVYFLLPGIAVAVSYIMAKFLVRFAPGVWRILSGGRKLEG